MRSTVASACSSCWRSISISDSASASLSSSRDAGGGLEVSAPHPQPAASDAATQDARQRSASRPAETVAAPAQATEAVLERNATWRPPDVGIAARRARLNARGYPHTCTVTVPGLTTQVSAPALLNEFRRRLIEGDRTLLGHSCAAPRVPAAAPGARALHTAPWARRVCGGLWWAAGGCAGNGWKRLRRGLDRRGGVRATGSRPLFLV